MRSSMRVPGWLATLGVHDEDLPAWWQKIDQDPHWQKYSFIGLAVGYGLIAAVALVQLARIQRRCSSAGLKEIAAITAAAAYFGSK